MSSYLRAPILAASLATLSSVASISMVPAVAAIAVGGCKETPSNAVKESTPPVAASVKKVTVGTKRYGVESAGDVTIKIDAPLEQFKGHTRKLSGVLDVNISDLKSSTGEVIADLDDVKTVTFNDPDKDDTQTGHVKNWFEIGKDVEPAKRDDYRMVRFTIEKIEEATPNSVADAPEQAGVRRATIKASGTFRVHGRSVKKTAVIDVAFKGPADAPTEISFKSKEPLVVSLSEHDVKPRDIAGKFLVGALEKVGKKIDDKAQVMVEGTAKPKG